MGLEKKTLKIIAVTFVVLLLLGATLGVLLAFLLPQRYVELEVWPRSEEFGKWEEPRIEFRADDPGSWHVWVRRIDDFLRVYETSVPEDPPLAPCWTGRRPPPTPACAHALSLWTPCTSQHNYGYAHGTPCVFLRLSHIHKWHPEPYNNSVPLPLPPEMPPHLVNMIRSGARLGDYAWVSCGGSFPADEEHVGPLQVLPSRSLPGFRLRRLRTARSGLGRRADEEPTPLLAVLFENPRRGVVISVECRVWTRDLYYYHDYGRARFQIYIE